MRAHAPRAHHPAQEVGTARSAPLPTLQLRWIASLALAMTISRSAVLWCLKTGLAICAKPCPQLRTSALDHRLEHPAHLGLRLLHARLQRGKIRRVAGSRQDVQEVFARRFRLEAIADAEPEDLR
jgi:hypothetical protein